MCYQEFQQTCMARIVNLQTVRIWIWTVEEIYQCVCYLCETVFTSTIKNERLFFLIFCYYMQKHFSNAYHPVIDYCMLIDSHFLKFYEILFQRYWTLNFCSFKEVIINSMRSLIWKSSHQVLSYSWMSFEWMKTTFYLIFWFLLRY